MTDRYWVIGNPIQQSKSPLLHGEFARQTGQAMDYQAFCAPLDGFVDSVNRFRQEGGLGMNVTVPFKIQAYELATEWSERAMRAQAVNTLTFIGDRILGDNTDGAGLVRDIVEQQGHPIAGKRVLIMGAGGATRGILLPLLQEAPASVMVANRTLARAEQLLSLFGADYPLRVGDYAALAGECFDVIINATSASLDGSVPPLAAANFAPGALAYDLVYGKEDTAFMRFARECGVEQVVDGLGMLVEQAAESFFIWRGVRVNTTPVLQKMRSD